MDNIVVIKFGGNALSNETSQYFCAAIAQLRSLSYSPVIVHGGGPQIDAMLATAGIEPHFVNGMRYTDEHTLAIAEMVLSGSVNKMIVAHLGGHNVNAVGINGKDGKTIIAQKRTSDDHGVPVDLGSVGTVTCVNPELLQLLLGQGFTPVIAPIALGDDGATYNINADYAAAAIAQALQAQRFVLMTNIAGLLDADGALIEHATPTDIEQLISDGVISGGMIPKTRSITSILSDVQMVNIIDGRAPDNLISLFSEQQIGTTIQQ